MAVALLAGKISASAFLQSGIHRHINVDPFRADLLSTFKRNFNYKAELFDIAYSKREHSVWSLLLCASDSFATYGAI